MKRLVLELPDEPENDEHGVFKLECVRINKSMREVARVLIRRWTAEKQEARQKEAMPEIEPVPEDPEPEEAAFHDEGENFIPE